MILTPREEQVSKLLATGATNRDIANALRISIKTVDTHRGHALTKLGLRNNVDLARYALRRGWVDINEPGETVLFKVTVGPPFDDARPSP